MALTPNGQTLYVADEPDTVTPIATATNTPGKPIKVGQNPDQILVTPDGQTAYVADNSGVTPFSTATNTPEKPITGTGPESGGPHMMAITPDGKTLYVASGNTVIPVSTATNTPGKPILLGDQVSPSPDQVIITPDGSTLYVFNYALNPNFSPYGVITPVSTATNTPGQPIPVVADLSFAMAMTPDGNTFYVAAGDGQDVVPISTATNTPGQPINVAGAAVAFICSAGAACGRSALDHVQDVVIAVAKAAVQLANDPCPVVVRPGDIHRLSVPAEGQLALPVPCAQISSCAPEVSVRLESQLARVSDRAVDDLPAQIQRHLHGRLVPGAEDLLDEPAQPPPVHLPRPGRILEPQAPGVHQVKAHSCRGSTPVPGNQYG
jgi:YVTN family beta-propeller protein